jgi:hypothetical protein
VIRGGVGSPSLWLVNADAGGSGYAVNGLRRYDITVGGVASDLVRAEFDDVQISVVDGCTRFRTPSVDQAWLSGLLRRIEQLGLVLVELTIAEDSTCPVPPVPCTSQA